MSKIERFEDIIAWQKARSVNNEIYEFSSNGRFSKDFALKDQILRASNSIMLNIAEGFGRRSNKEFIQCLVIAHGEASEIQSALYIALDRKYISEELFEKLYSDCAELSKIIMGFIKYLRSQR
jgi:four helix bundle protein